MSINFFEQRYEDLVIDLNIHFLGFAFPESVPIPLILTEEEFKTSCFANTNERILSFDDFKSMMIDHLIGGNGIELEDLEWSKIEITYNQLKENIEYLKKVQKN
ncbi:hypothetical protein HLH17_14405 [Acinetobacter sp. ANC 5380]|uniref:Uncharacterized protein n=1 Tax=Acinetobacter terrae TaxID=2731247 RepID=A0A7Y2WCH4_9GAMM|nr:hypothetical protein [Acinetobacter terrae]NNH78813.1 hypothetical protein [Acinetobacter terrae]